MQSDGSTESRPTKEFLSAPARFLSGSFPGSRLLRRARTTKHALGQITHGGLPKLPGRAPCPFLAAEPIVTKQTRDRVAAAKKMDLKAVSLFFGAGFRIDAPDVLFRIGISSFFHLRHSR